jgi:hypothetical protein
LNSFLASKLFPPLESFLFLSNAIIDDIYN